MVKNDVTAAELAEIIGANKAVIIDFYATWCGPCKMFAPVFERVAEKNAGSVQFVRIDVDKAPELADRYAVKSIPTVVGIRNGTVAHFSSGMMNEPSLQTVIDELLIDAPDIDAPDIDTPDIDTADIDAPDIDAPVIDAPVIGASDGQAEQD